MRAARSILSLGLFAASGCHHHHTVEREPPLPGPDPADVRAFDLQIPARAPVVTLEAAGSGARAALRFAPAPSSRAATELRFDESTTADGSATDPLPTAILHADVNLQPLEQHGTGYRLTIVSADTHYLAGEPRAPRFENALVGLGGVTFTWVVQPEGGASAISVHGDAVPRETRAALAVLASMWMSPWPAVPSEPIGVGARWSATATYAIAGATVDETIVYELRAHEGSSWVIHGTSTLHGHAPPANASEVAASDGGGEIEITYTDGAVMPALHARRTLRMVAAAGGRTRQLAVTLGNDTGPDQSPSPAK